MDVERPADPTEVASVETTSTRILSAEEERQILAGMRVAHAVATLSLDIARPFLSPMGAGDIDVDLLVTTCRDVVALHRRTMGDRDERPMPNVRSELRRAAVARLGDEGWTRLSRWLDRVHHIAFTDLPDDHGWLRVFEAAAFQHGRASELSLPASQRQRILREHMEATDLGDIDQRIAAMRSDGYSDWDVEMFLRRGDNPFDQTCDPFIPLRRFVRLRRFQAFLGRLTVWLSREQAQRVATAARRMLDGDRTPPGRRLLALDELVTLHATPLNTEPERRPRKETTRAEDQ